MENKAEEETHPRKRGRVVPLTNAPNFSDPTSLVTFIIGPDAIEFKVHKEFVCAHSSVFQAAFNGPFVEGQTQKYTIDDTSALSFRFLVQWIYQQKLDIVQLKTVVEKEKFTLSDPNWMDEEDQALAELWVLADKFAIPKLQNEAIASMIQIQELGEIHSFATAVYSYIYANTSPGSMLRKLVVEQCCCILSVSFKKWPEIYPHELLIELVCSRADALDLYSSPFVPEEFFVDVNGN